MRGFIVSILVTLATCHAAGAQQHAATGAGVGSCAKYAKAYREDPELADALYFSWAQGFMSGLNRNLLLTGKPIRNLAKKGLEEQQRHLRAFCDKRPLATYFEAVLNLFESLPAEPPQSN